MEDAETVMIKVWRNWKIKNNFTTFVVKEKMRRSFKNNRLTSVPGLGFVTLGKPLLLREMQARASNKLHYMATKCVASSALKKTDSKTTNMNLIYLQKITQYSLLYVHVFLWALKTCFMTIKVFKIHSLRFQM